MQSSKPFTVYARPLSPYAHKHLSAPEFEDQSKHSFFTGLYSTLDNLTEGFSEQDRISVKMFVRHLNVHPTHSRFGLKHSRGVLSALEDVREERRLLASEDVRESGPREHPEIEDLVLTLDHAIPTYPFLEYRHSLIGWAKSINDARAAEANAKQALADARQASRDEKASLSVQPTADAVSMPPDASAQDLCAALSALPKRSKSRSARQAIDAVHARVKTLAPSLSLLQTAALLDQARGRLQCKALLHALLELHEDKFPQTGADNAPTELMALSRRVGAVRGMQVEEIRMVLRCIMRHEGTPATTARILCFKSLAPQVASVTSQADLLALVDACTPLWRCSAAGTFLGALGCHLQTARNIDDVLHAWAGRFRGRTSADLMEIALALVCTVGRDAAPTGRGAKVDEFLSAVRPFLSRNPLFITKLDKMFTKLGQPMTDALVNMLKVRYQISMEPAPMHGEPVSRGAASEHVRARINAAIDELRDLAKRGPVIDENLKGQALTYRGQSVMSFSGFVDTLAADCTAWMARRGGATSSLETATAAAPGMLMHRGRIVSLLELPGLLRPAIDPHARASHQEAQTQTQTQTMTQTQTQTQTQTRKQQRRPQT